MLNERLIDYWSTLQVIHPKVGLRGYKIEAKPFKILALFFSIKYYLQLRSTNQKGSSDREVSSQHESRQGSREKLIKSRPDNEIRVLKTERKYRETAAAGNWKAFS